MENQIIPLLRKSKLNGELEKIRKWKKEGKTKEEILNLIDKRIALPEDVEEIFKEENIEVENLQETTTEETEKITSEEKQEEDKVEELEESEEVLKEDIEDNSFNLNDEELEEVLSNENFYTEENVLKNKDSEEHEEVVIEDENEEKITSEENQIDSEIKEDIKSSEKEEFKYLKDEELEDFPDQPFKLYNEDKKEEMIQSIRINGIIQPLVVRPLDNGKFQILAGHNRRICGREAGLKEFPCKIKYGLTDAESKLYLIDTNLATREKITPTEKAKALLIRKNAYKTEIIRKKIQAGVLEDNPEIIDVREKVQEIENMSNGMLQRYLRLNHLEESLQELVDNEKLSLKVAENLSFIARPQQRIISNMIEKENIKISESQSKKLKNEEILNKEKILEILQKKDSSKDEEEIVIKFKKTEIEGFFENLEPKIIKEKILNMLQN